jgi:DNA adenine methylase
MTGTFNYPGSKTTLSGWIISHFPQHTQYIEPFGGAASVLVDKAESDLEVYNDLNGDCVNFFEAVRDRPNELSRWVENTPTSRQLYQDYVEEYPDWPDDTVESAGRFLYVQHHSFGGKGVLANSSTYGIITAKSYRGSELDAYENKWDIKNEHIFTLRDRLKGVNIECLDYSDIIEKYDAPEAFFYFDPPYVEVGDAYYQTTGDGFDHSRFVEAVLNMEAKWLISYDQNIPDKLADYHSTRRTKTAAISSQKPEKVETLTMNYDPNQTSMFSEPDQQTLPTLQE